MDIGDRVKFINKGMRDLYGIEGVIVDIDDDDTVELDNGCFFMKGNVEVITGSVKQDSTLDRIKTFTMNHKDIEITFEDGMIKVRDWYGRGDPVEYTVDTLQQLEELMCAWENLCKFKTVQEV